MTDKLTDVVRLLYAERYGRNTWWSSEKERQKVRRQQLEAALDKAEKKERQAAE